MLGKKSSADLPSRKVLRPAPASPHPLTVEGASTCWKRRSPAIGARAVTVSEAALLVTAPPELLTVTVKFTPPSANAVAGVVKMGLVAPAMAAPFFAHWYCSDSPMVLTAKVADSPMGTLWSA